MSMPLTDFLRRQSAKTRQAKCVSVDALPPQLAYLRSGHVQLLPAQQCFEWGYRSVEQLVNKLHLNEVRRELYALDERVARLERSLASAVVLYPPEGAPDRVRFGATVTVRRGGEKVRYRIVGVDEADFERGWISWLSPLAKVLLNTQVGQRVRFKAPSGEQESEIVGIEYE